MMRRNTRMDYANIVHTLIETTTGEKFDLIESSDPLSSFGITSISLVTLLVSLEERLGREFDDSDLNPSKLRCVDDLIGLVSKYAPGTERVSG
jgi:acyl carrier protein